MQSVNFLQRSALVLICLGSHAACAQPVTVTVSSGGHPIAATATGADYSAQCPGRQYVLRVSKASGSMQLVVDDGNRRTVDISATPFAQTFLRRPLYGQFGLACGHHTLVVSFMGVELQQAGAPKAVSYGVVFDNDGKATSDGGLRDEDFGTINRHLIGH
ncbi:MAG: hypothetical protein ACLGI6_17545 [Gammaproteobacteria bacterium]